MLDPSTFTSVDTVKNDLLFCDLWSVSRYSVDTIEKRPKPFAQGYSTSKKQTKRQRNTPKHDLKPK